MPLLTLSHHALAAVVSLVAAGPVRSMTLDDALGYARAHQPTLQRARARVAAAAAQARVPRAQWLPSFGATAQALAGTANNTTASYVGVRGVDIPRIGGTPATADGSWKPELSTLAAVGGTPELYDFGRIAAEAAAADLATDVEAARADADRLRVEQVVKDAYYGVAGARAVLHAAEDAYARAQVHRDMAGAAVKSGLHAPIELTRAEADLAKFEVGRIRAGGSLRAAQALFAAAVGVDARLLDAAGEPGAPAPVPPIEAGIARLMDRDPTLREARAQAAQSDAAARAIGAALRPELALTGTLSARAGTATPSGGPLDDAHGPWPTVPNWDVGLVLRWPLFDAGLRARRDAAVSAGAVARADLAVRAQQAVAAVEQAYVAFELGQAALTGLSHAVDAARANYAQAEARFKAGLGTSLELADAESVRVDAEVQLAVGQYEVQRARAAIANLLAEES
jgi:outer membrane protein